MRAAVVRKFGAPSCIEIVSNYEKPKIQTPHQVLVKVKSSGVNPVDTYIRSGQYAVVPELPYVVGRDGAGIVEEVGSSISQLKKGDRVWFHSTNGSAAEYCVAHVAVPLPEGLTFIEGAGLAIPYMTAYRALFIKGKAKAGDRILVHGASGGVGLAACQLASDHGITVVGTAGTDDGCELVKENGAKDVYRHDMKNYVDLMSEKYPEGFNLILEMNAHINLATDLELLSKNGQVAVIGSRGDVVVAPRMLMGTESSIFGIALAQSTPEEYALMGTEINKLFAKTKYRPIIDKEYSLEETAQAHKDIMAPKAKKHGKLVITL